MSAASRPSVLAGLIGYGIGGSRTPAMHEREGDEQGLRYTYKLLDLAKFGAGVELLPQLLQAVKWTGFSGLNITYPCKQAIIPLLDDLSEEARALNAVNTVVIRDGRAVGHNTDWYGFAEAFKRGFPDVKRNRVVQFGAGGAGSAVAYALGTLGVQHLTIVDVDPARAGAVAESFCERFGAGRAEAGTDKAQVVAAADGIVNTTPLGMDKSPGMALQAELLRPDLWVAEIVYFPIETALLKAARAIGAPTLDGGGMAVFQAVGAFQLISGVKPDPERMLRHFAEFQNPGGG
ncbi:MAG: shikimate dehydrogenase [Acetobacteraceae bacterium]|nr:shikimate dehydrogenase [Acetobacteraceae bacterium]